jgi:hypothetical protein
MIKSLHYKVEIAKNKNKLQDVNRSLLIFQWDKHYLTLNFISTTTLFEEFWQRYYLTLSLYIYGTVSCVKLYGYGF